MAFVVAAAAVVLLVAPGAMDRFGRRLAPSEWSRLCAIALGSGLVRLELALVLLAGPVVLRTVGPPALAAACASGEGTGRSSSRPASWAQ